ncbi:MAG: ABC transporter permease subunit [Candidatus Zixiibacteriota bacterium]|nr:MAG: ABC transporter permease subunit [candidate division Zixibacteria bacterium]
MLVTLITKELKSIILSPKFTGTFAVCTLLIILSVFTGVREYKQSVSRFDAASRLTAQNLQQQTSWGNLQTRAYRAPDPMQIFVSGLEYDIGRWSDVTTGSSAKLKNSIYSDETIYALFRVIDFTFIVQFILTLFAILFTYNAVSGEREDGTLRLVFSNTVSRAQYLMAKCIGSWLGLVVPITIPILLGLLIVLLSGVPLSAGHWLRIALLMGLSLLLFTFFIVLGVFISALTRYSAVSFLSALVVWVLFVLIIPRVGVMSSANLVSVPRTAEIEGRISGFAKQSWQEFYQGFDARMGKEQAETSMGAELSDEMLWEMMQTEDSLRKSVEQEIDRYDLKLREDLRQRKAQQENLAFTLSRLSPASAYQLGAMSLAGTDINVKSRYEEMVNAFRTQFLRFMEQKQLETGDNGRMMMAISISDTASNLAMTGRKKHSLDLSGLPQFTPPAISLSDSLSPAITDFGILALYTILAFMGAFIAFLRYDLR